MIYITGDTHGDMNRIQCVCAGLPCECGAA